MSNRFEHLRKGPLLEDPITEDPTLNNSLDSKQSPSRQQSRKRSPSPLRQRSRKQPRQRSRSPSRDDSQTEYIKLASGFCGFIEMSFTETQKLKNKNPSLYKIYMQMFESMADHSQTEYIELASGFCGFIEMSFAETQMLKNKNPSLYKIYMQMFESMTDCRLVDNKPNAYLSKELVHMNIARDKLAEQNFNEYQQNCIYFNRHRDADPKDFDKHDCFDKVKSFVESNRSFFGRYASVVFCGKLQNTIAIYHSKSQTLKEIEDVVFGKF